MSDAHEDDLGVYGFGQIDRERCGSCARLGVVDGNEEAAQRDLGAGPRRYHERRDIASPQHSVSHAPENDAVEPSFAGRADNEGIGFSYFCVLGDRFGRATVQNDGRHLDGCGRYPFRSVGQYGFGRLFKFVHERLEQSEGAVHTRTLCERSRIIESVTQFELPTILVS